MQKANRNSAYDKRQQEREKRNTKTNLWQMEILFLFCRWFLIPSISHTLAPQYTIPYYSCYRFNVLFFLWPTGRKLYIFIYFHAIGLYRISRIKVTTNNYSWISCVLKIKQFFFCILQSVEITKWLWKPEGSICTLPIMF